MNEHVYVPIEVALYKELLNRYPGAANSTIQSVIGDFLERTREDFVFEEKRGVYWDKVFLPNGTQIRTKYFNETLVGEIENERIVWRNEEYGSISQMVNTMRGNTSNNAWKVSEVRRPGDSVWYAADRLR